MKVYIGDVFGYFIVIIVRMFFNFCVCNLFDIFGNYVYICCQCYVVFNWDVKFVCVGKNFINSFDKGKVFLFWWINIFYNIFYVNKIVIVYKCFFVFFNKDMMVECVFLFFGLWFLVFFCCFIN